ncbi:unnamed protein product [Ceutorhynchus assimilis]|uniref:Dihydrolipoamide acetyltransferase component of pyruvate dehydrogenase complex n=1 Tax=Ceutorhynchus assimilis TaxID=467358 RepID=A0A9N9Q8Y1_9CUCU|nr:unnamed protein product [Ceutorhynchus assimilis]
MSQIPVFFTRIFNLKRKNLFQELKNSRTIFTSFIFNKQVQFNLSDIGEGIREVVVKEWFIKIGDKVSQFDNICEVQSDKASVTITSRYDGVITKLHYQIDDIALVGQPLIDLETSEKADENEAEGKCTKAENASVQRIEPEKLQSPPLLQDSNSSDSSDKNAILCLPSVRRLAKENNIDLAEVKGNGKQGRILKQDVLKYMEDYRSAEKTSISSETKTAFGNDDIKIEPITGFQKAMVKTMTEALKIPHFIYSDEIKITKLSTLRKELKAVRELDVKLTFMPFFIKAASNALQKYPIINSSIDEKCQNIIYRRNHNIGVAMHTNQGLAVPVIKNVNNLTILDVARELNRIIQTGKSGSFSISDLSGATFTISNIGVVGGTYTKPVILPPQVAIIAIGATQILPRFDQEGNIIKEEIINISGAADHRVIDGVSMASFIETLKKQIENPNLLFLNL